MNCTWYSRGVSPRVVSIHVVTSDPSTRTDCHGRVHRCTISTSWSAAIATIVWHIVWWHRNRNRERVKIFCCGRRLLLENNEIFRDLFDSFSLLMKFILLCIIHVVQTLIKSSSIAIPIKTKCTEQCLSWQYTCQLFLSQMREITRISKKFPTTSEHSLRCLKMFRWFPKGFKMSRCEAQNLAILLACH